ncbi:MAG: Na+/H+ antiporter subunit E [Reyranella sp.]|jgi:multicomponent Na+:H+ antiporter subunit E|nr:Na+/H+ antiporter subunit E [Reyranella sp.]MBL6650804.1 Na+/H+ antiporter subunit E [Reyranella sp.]
MSTTVAIGRATLFFALWLMIAGYRLADVPVGVAAAALATWASLRLMPPGTLRLRLWSLASFGVHFLGQSVSAGIEVAWLALRPSMPLRPGFVTWRPRLQSASARNAFCAVSSLLPGTLPAGSDDDGALLIHCLDVDQPVADNLTAEEQLFGRMIGHD